MANASASIDLVQLTLQIISRLLDRKPQIARAHLRQLRPRSQRRQRQRRFGAGGNHKVEAAWRETQQFRQEAVDVNVR